MRIQVKDAALAQLLVTFQLLQALCLRFYFLAKLAHEGRLVVRGLRLRLARLFGVEKTRLRFPLFVLDRRRRFLVAVEVVITEGRLLRVLAAVRTLHLPRCKLSPVFVVLRP